MGWYVRNKSEETASYVERGVTYEVDAGEAVDINPRIAVPLTRDHPETWERILPSDPEYKPVEER